MSVTFSNIPQTLYEPLFYVEFSNVAAGVNQQTQPSLIIGQSLLGSSPAPEFVPSPQWAAQNFGTNSMLARMARTYFAADPVGPLYALPLADAVGAVAATGSIVFSGTATSSGTINLYVAGNQLVGAVPSGGLSANIAAGIVQAFASYPYPLPVTAAVSNVNSSEVIFTAVHKGAVAGQIDIRLNYLGSQAGQVLPPGISAVITPLTGGAVDPDLIAAAVGIGDQPFDFVAYPYGGNATLFAEITAEMNDQSGRWAFNRQDYGHAFSMMPGTPATLLATGATVNDQHQTLIGVQNPLNPPWDWAADWAGTVAPSIRALPSRPLQTLQLSTCLTPAVSDWFNFGTREQLLATGIALPKFHSYGGPQILRSVTTYQRNALGVPDQSYLDCETLFTLMAITRQLKSALTQKFPRAILVPDGTRVGSGQPVISPKIALAEIATQYLAMEQNLLVTSAAQMLAATVVQINPQNPSRLDILWAPYLANGLRIIAMVNQFRLNANA